MFPDSTQLKTIRTRTARFLQGNLNISQIYYICRPSFVKAITGRDDIRQSNQKSQLSINCNHLVDRPFLRVRHDHKLWLITLRWRVSPAHANNLEFSSVRSHELKYKFTSSLHPSIAPPHYKCSITFAKEYL